MIKDEKNEVAVYFNRKLDEELSKRKQVFQSFWPALGFHKFARTSLWLPNVKNLAGTVQEIGVTCDYMLGLTDQVLPGYLATEYHDAEDVEFSALCRVNDLLDEGICSLPRLSNLTGSVPDTVDRWVKFSRVPGTFPILQICRQFGYSFDYMIGLTEEKKLSSPYVP